MPVLEEAPANTSIEFVLEQLAVMESHVGDAMPPGCNGCNHCS
ncbi:MAG TPA: hypothetical protein VGS19_20505 [Streptosporangiaceae bacterium]|nr:hypothetical protein [Streptosporangiaceae bacterium]